LEHLFRRLTDPAVSDLDALADFVWFRKLALDAKDVSQALGAATPSGPPVSLPASLTKPAPTTTPATKAPQPALAGDGPVMPFGKWKGSALSRVAQVDAGYLRYMLTKELREPLLGQIKAALAAAGHPMPPAVQVSQPASNADDVPHHDVPF